MFEGPSRFHFAPTLNGVLRPISPGVPANQLRSHVALVAARAFSKNASPSVPQQASSSPSRTPNPSTSHSSVRRLCGLMKRSLQRSWLRIFVGGGGEGGGGGDGGGGGGGDGGGGGKGGGIDGGGGGGDLGGGNDGGAGGDGYGSHGGKLSPGGAGGRTLLWLLSNSTAAEVTIITPAGKSSSSSSSARSCSMPCGESSIASTMAKIMKPAAKMQAPSGLRSSR